MYNNNVNCTAGHSSGVRWKILFSTLIKLTTSVCSHVLCDIIAVRIPGWAEVGCSVTFWRGSEGNICIPWASSPGGPAGPWDTHDSDMTNTGRPSSCSRLQSALFQPLWPEGARAHYRYDRGFPELWSTIRLSVASQSEPLHSPLQVVFTLVQWYGLINGCSIQNGYRQTFT